MDYIFRNRELMAGYFEDGCKKPFRKQTFGVELEHFVVDNDTNKTLDYFGERGIESLLDEMSGYFGRVYRSEGHIIGLKRDGLAISLEPAAQLETSIDPESGLAEIEKAYKSFRHEIEPILVRFNCRLVERGYHPVSTADSLSMIPKNRYRFMFEHFSKAGSKGKYMMKGTAATQISIDYYSEQDFAEKYRTLLLLTPVFSLITDNAPVFEGKAFDGYLLRSRIWDDVDNERVKYAERLSGKGIGFASYAEFVMSSPLIFFIQNNREIPVAEKADSYFAEQPLSQEDIEHILSMSFPDIRLKKYIEIRCADSMPFAYVLSYLALIKGLFARQPVLHSVFGPSSDVDITVARAAEAKKNIMEHGLDASVYGTSAAEIISLMFQEAAGNLPPDEKRYLNPLMDLVLKDKKLPRNICREVCPR